MAVSFFFPDVFLTRGTLRWNLFGWGGLSLGLVFWSVCHSTISPYASLLCAYRNKVCFLNWSRYMCMNGHSALHKKFLMLFIRMTSELSAVTSIFIYEVAMFEQLVPSGECVKTARLLSLQFPWCCCLWREIITAMLQHKPDKWKLSV